jgi:hypothetical protein
MDAPAHELVVAELVVPEVRLDNHDLELIRRQVAVPRGGRLPNEVELEDFARYCSVVRLNPFDRQIYLAHIGGRWQSYVGVHGRLAIAARSREVDGMEGPFYCHKREGIDRQHPPDWSEVWDDDDPPHAAMFIVYRQGWTKGDPPGACKGVAHWKLYNKGTGLWQTNPLLMIGYKAMSVALNRAFPHLMPSAPERAEDEPDIDESIGYSRSDDVPLAVDEPVDAGWLPAEVNLTPAATLIELRRLAQSLGVTPPRGLDAVDPDLVDGYRRQRESSVGVNRGDVDAPTDEPPFEED